MARALSPVYSIIRGSVAGLTYLSNQYHQIVVRARTAPVQPNTTYQAMMRTAFGAAEAIWNASSQAVIDAWSDYAATVIRSGPLGNYAVKNRQQFLSTLSLASYLNTRFGETIPVSNDAPANTGWLKISNFNLAAPGAAGTGFAVNITNDEDHAVVVLIQRSPGFKPTKNFYKGPWIASVSQVLSIPATTSGTVDVTGLDVDAVYFFRIRAISDSAEHRVSNSFISRGVAQTTV